MHYAGMDVFLHTLHEQKQHCHALVSKLLSNVIAQEPSNTAHLYFDEPEPQSSTSMLGMFTSVASEVVMAPARAVYGLLRQSTRSDNSPVAEASLSLLLLLLHQGPPTVGAQGSGFQDAFQVYSEWQSPARHEHRKRCVPG
jgi:Dyggve-Melchior-Clausen syndrome protein